MRGRLLVTTGVAVAVLVGCGAHGAPVTTPPQVAVGSVGPLVVEVADDRAERASGLKGRASVPAGTGMAFVYEEPVSNSFWMGDVDVPLSIIWVRGDTVVGVAEMEPCPAADATCPEYTPSTPYDLAVETTGGTFTDAGVTIGDAVTVTGLDDY